MDENLFKRRTKQLALQIIRLVNALPKNRIADVPGRQLLRAGTSIGANYRAACRGRSHAEYTAKIGVVAEESDETLGWLEFIEAATLISQTKLADLLQEAKELCAIFSASYGTAKRRERGNSG